MQSHYYTYSAQNVFLILYSTTRVNELQHCQTSWIIGVRFNLKMPSFINNNTEFVQIIHTNISSPHACAKRSMAWNPIKWIIKTKTNAFRPQRGKKTHSLTKLYRYQFSNLTNNTIGEIIKLLDLSTHHFCKQCDTSI